MAEIWPNLLPHKTFRADASLRQRLDSGHFLFPPLLPPFFAPAAVAWIAV